MSAQSVIFMEEKEREENLRIEELEKLLNSAGRVANKMSEFAEDLQRLLEKRRKTRAKQDGDHLAQEEMEQFIQNKL